MSKLPLYSMFVGCQTCDESYISRGEFCPRYFSPEPGELWQLAFSSVSLKHQPQNWPMEAYGPMQYDNAISENCTITCSLVKGEFKTPSRAALGPIPLEIFSVEKDFFESGNPNFKDAVTIHFNPKFYTINTYGPEFEVRLKTPLTQMPVRLPAKITYHIIFRRLR